LTSDLNAEYGVSIWTLDQDALEEIIEEEFNRGPGARSILAPNGKYLVSRGKTFLTVYDMQERQILSQSLHDYDTGIGGRSMTINRDSKTMLVERRQGCLDLVEIETLRVLMRYGGHLIGQYVIVADFGSVDDRLIFSGSEGE
jgi:hypothetical protein